MRTLTLRKGVTLVEMLIAMAIFGTLLAILGAFFGSNSRISNQQISATDANLSLRQSLLRMTEIITQAAYIYPAGQTITLTGGSNVTRATGNNALAILVPAGTTYCMISTANYCGYLFSIENRTDFTAILGTSSSTQFTLVEWRSDGLIWAINTFPPTSVATWANATRAVMSDNVVPSTVTNGSSLAAVGNLSISDESAIYDDDITFDFTNAGRNANNGLIGAVAPRLVIQSKNGSTKATRATNIFSRAIPRAGQPIPITTP
jgi:prepilin-type N-terminal cleavage/methylation domain-containing protein